MKESSKNDLELKISLREANGHEEEKLVNYQMFKGMLRNFSQLKIDKELIASDVDDFKEELLRNKSENVILFVEKSLRIPLIHPYIFMILFDVVKILLAKEKISKEKYSLLCDVLIRERKADISRYYDLKKMKIYFLSV